MPHNPQSDDTKNYVLIGYGQNPDIEKWHRQAHDVIIKPDSGFWGNLLSKPKPSESIENIIKQITPPGNLIMYVHGHSGNQFEWGDGQYINYEDLFKKLPRIGIQSITLAICEDDGAITYKTLKAAPAGAIVQSLVSPTSVTTMGLNTKFADEAAGEKQGINLTLEMFDNFNPSYYTRAVSDQNKIHDTHFDTSADHALPKTLYIAGPNPRTINLESEMQQIATLGKAKINAPAMAAAIKRVKDRFDVADIVATKELGVSAYRADDPAEDKKLYQRIQAIGEGLKSGMLKPEELPTKVEEKRIGLAITAAYLYESHRLQYYVDEQTPCDAYGKPIQAAARIPSSEPNITPDENAYVKSIEHKLAGRAKSLLQDVVTVFKETKNNDKFEKDGKLDKALNQEGISTKSWIR